MISNHPVRHACLVRLLASTVACMLSGNLTATGAERPEAVWPPHEGKLRVVIDTDAANEVDDQYALALAMGFPERLTIEGIVAAHFGAATDGIERSYSEIQSMLQLAGMSGQVRVERGVPALADEETLASGGVDIIIEQALRACRH